MAEAEKDMPSHRQNREQKLAQVKRDLLTAVRGPAMEIEIGEIREKGLIATLRKHAQPLKQSNHRKDN